MTVENNLGFLHFRGCMWGPREITTGKYLRESKN